MKFTISTLCLRTKRQTSKQYIKKSFCDNQALLYLIKNTDKFFYIQIIIASTTRNILRASSEKNGYFGKKNKDFHPKARTI